MWFLSSGYTIVIQKQNVNRIPTDSWTFSHIYHKRIRIKVVGISSMFISIFEYIRIYIEYIYICTVCIQIFLIVIYCIWYTVYINIIYIPKTSNMIVLGSDHMGLGSLLRLLGPMARYREWAECCHLRHCHWGRHPPKPGTEIISVLVGFL